MIVRLVLATVVAAALLGAAMPVVEDARHDASATQADRETRAIADAITHVGRSTDPVPPGVPGGERVVTVDIPAEATVTVGSGPNGSDLDGSDSDVVSYVVGDVTSDRVPVPVDTRVAAGDDVLPDEQGLVLSGTERVVVRHVLVDGRPTVVVDRV
ncbi:MAG: DUF7311 family protein [Halolamina sp.]